MLILHLRDDLLNQICIIEDLKTHFGAYGNVDAVSIKYDSVTGNPRGFGFITFVDGSVIDKVTRDALCLRVLTHIL